MAFRLLFICKIKQNVCVLTGFNIFTADEASKSDDGPLQNVNKMKKSSSYVSSNGIYNGNQIVVEVETNIPAYKTNGMLPNS